MSQHALASRLTVESARQAAELSAMRRMLHAAHGAFTFAVAVCNSPALRDYLIEQLQQSFPRIVVVNIPPGTVDVYGFVTAQELVGDPDAVFLVGLERSMRIAESPDAKPSREPTAETRHLLRSFNASRDLWPDRLNCPLVVWLPEYAAMLLAGHAHDLWRFVSHSFEFVSEQATAVASVSDRFAGDIGAAANLTADEKRFRIAELEQRLSDAGQEPANSLLPHISVWSRELAFLYSLVGELKLAEKWQQNALANDRRLGVQEGMAADFGNLGMIYYARGELARAKELHQEAAVILEKLGHQEGMANQYGNLGRIYAKLGESKHAETMYNKALAVYERLNNKKGIATQSGNLALILQARGELDRAEEMHQRALAINEQIGNQEGMADAYCNLGVIHKTRGNLDRAEEMFQNSLAIEQKLGRVEGMATDLGNLGTIHRTRGELARAEELFRQALSIDEKIGHLEGVARHCSNLGLLAEDRADLAQARALWTKARDLYSRIGMPHMVKQMQDWIDDLARASDVANQ